MQKNTDSVKYNKNILADEPKYLIGVLVADTSYNLLFLIGSPSLLTQSCNQSLPTTAVENIVFDFLPKVIAISNRDMLTNQQDMAKWHDVGTSLPL